MAQQTPPKKQFQYQDFQLLPQESLGIGSYGKVCKAVLDQLPCAAKLLHPVLFQFNDPASQTIVRRFEQECEFLSEIRHPHVVQYLGVARDPESGLLVLLMELMDESLTGFLERSNEPLPYHLQVNLCHDVALALAYLHLNGIIHRDLSSNNVLLIAGSRAKVTDFGMSKLSEMHPRITPLTQCPGTLAYMPPEALKVPPVYSKKLDVFSSGVVAVQIITRNFPDPGPPTMELEDARYPSGTVLVPVLEVERRKNHIDLINPTHPLLTVALDCLKNRERERPSAQELCQRIAALKVEPQYSQSVQEGEREGGRGDSGTAEVLAAKDRDIRERDNQLQEKDNLIRTLEEEVGVVNQRLQMAGVQVRRLQDTKIEELRQKDEELQQKDEELQRKDEELQRKVQEKLELQSQELYQKNRELDQKNRELQEKDDLLQQLRLQLVSQATPTSLTFKVSGAGLEAATVKACSQFSIEVLYSDGRPCSSSQRVTAELISKTAWSVTKATVVQKSPTTYEVTYTPTTRGRHELCVRVNGDEIQGSPFRVVVYPDPTQLHQPVRVIEEVRRPWGVAFNSLGEMYVAESSSYHGQVAVCDSSGKRISYIGSKGDGPGQFQYPYYIAIDSNDNIYVTSQHKLQKFDRNGKFVKSVGSGSGGSKPGEFNLPRGVKVHQNRIYVCDFHNNRVQLFDLELLFITSIGTKGSGQGQFNRPEDLAVDSQGNIYVSEYGNNRVQVLDPNGRYLRQFGDKSGPGKLNSPEGIQIAHDCVYVSDCDNHRIAVFQLSGAFLTSFGKEGEGRGEFRRPCGIMFDCDGVLYVCDWLNDRIQVF